jgi:hypothetical protein
MRCTVVAAPGFLDRQRQVRFPSDPFHFSLLAILLTPLYVEGNRLGVAGILAQEIVHLGG